MQYQVSHRPEPFGCSVGKSRASIVNFIAALFLLLHRASESWNGSMNSTSQGNHGAGLTLRQAALIAGFSYLLGPVTYAEFSIYPKLVIPNNITQTVQNIAAHQGLFAAAILCYLVEFIEDIVIAWALYVLLVPVNRAMSLLAAWFRLMYTAIAFFGMTSPPLVRASYGQRLSFCSVHSEMIGLSGWRCLESISCCWAI